MTHWIAALPMYDWPETRTETDALWANIRDALRQAGIDPPDRLTRDADFHALWRAPNLFIAQTCWGPMGQGLSEHVRVIGQPDYSDVEGGDGEFYRSVVLARRTGKPEGDAEVPVGAKSSISPNALWNLRLAFNSTDSMSGYLALEGDMRGAGAALEIFSERLETGGHRASIIAVAEGRADVCAIDCRSWALAQRFEPAAKTLAPIGWTAPRKGLPYIASKNLTADVANLMRDTLLARNLILSNG